LKVKPQKKGFATTGFLSKDDEDGVQRIVGKSAQEPSWRNVAAWIESDEEVALAGTAPMPYSLLKLVEDHA
jgi:hypothetical protein